MSKKKKILLTVLVILLVLVLAVKLSWSKILEASSASYIKGLEGNSDKYSLENVTVKDSVLNGKTIIFLGSSVTEGATSYGLSFVDCFASFDGVNAIKEAVSGTTLVTQDEQSYIPRMEKIDKEIKADAFVCQLSTNDASNNMPMGTVSTSMNANDFDTSTIAGAIEYIISYATNTWNCPVVFYTGTKYNNERYGEMVDLLLEIQEKWNCGVIDQWNNESLNDISDEQRTLYMVRDGVHPTRAGYIEWWFPNMEQYMESFFIDINE